ncbi:camphor resistance protein CrcB [Leucobacter komagatae]|uniref:Fluoride-specific ion channel FluC n=1 Tax=Leucobacter komagatae TaxID=55969 RepID=A0A542Y2Q2_9MICO|nr:CrcB family protein [Leucobacter komagatae]TQL42360.1 camphor resistance protein CrcB [Leucobacter komagatae]
MIAALLVAAGGGCGAILRYLLDRWVTRFAVRRASRGAGQRVPGTRFPWGITVVNLVGSLALGLLVGWLGGGASNATTAGGMAWLTVGVGLLGGFTTMSTASLDTVRLAQSGRIAAAAGNALGTLGAAALLAAVGILIGQAMS